MIDVNALLERARTAHSALLIEAPNGAALAAGIAALKDAIEALERQQTALARASFAPLRTDPSTWVLYLLESGDISPRKAAQWLRRYIHEGIEEALPEMGESILSDPAGLREIAKELRSGAIGRSLENIADVLDGATDMIAEARRAAKSVHECPGCGCNLVEIPQQHADDCEHPIVRSDRQDYQALRDDLSEALHTAEVASAAAAAMAEQRDKVLGENAELRRLFDLQSQAADRAPKRWREAADNEAAVHIQDYLRSMARAAGRDVRVPDLDAILDVLRARAALRQADLAEAREIVSSVIIPLAPGES